MLLSVITVLLSLRTSMTNGSKNICFLLAKAYQRACAIYKDKFGNYGLTPQQFGLLRFLWEEDGLTQVELSSRSQIDRTTIGGLIDRLQTGVPDFAHPCWQKTGSGACPTCRGAPESHSRTIES